MLPELVPVRIRFASSLYFFRFIQSDIRHLISVLWLQSTGCEPDLSAESLLHFLLRQGAVRQLNGVVSSEMSQLFAHSGGAIPEVYLKLESEGRGFILVFFLNRCVSIRSEARSL